MAVSGWTAGQPSVNKSKIFLISILSFGCLLIVHFFKACHQCSGDTKISERIYNSRADGVYLEQQHRDEKTKSKHDRNSIISLPGSVCCLSANDVGSRWPDPLPLVSKAIFPSLKCKLSRCF